MTSMAITRGTGFQMTFANGWTVSVQFGPGNYCDKRDLRTQPPADPHTATTAEVAVLDPKGRFHKIGENDDVLGWQSADDVARIIVMVSNFVSVTP